MRPSSHSVLEQENPALIGSQDARDLQALLYREIGVAAVAAALFSSQETDSRTEMLSDTFRERLESLPALLRSDIAA